MIIEILIIFALPYLVLMETQDTPNVDEYALQPVSKTDALSLASIRFQNASQHLCLGVILGRRTVMTSAPCISSYIPIFSMLKFDFEQGKCLVIVNSRDETPPKESDQRFCMKFEMKNRTWWSYGKQSFPDFPVNILVDYPLAKENAQRMRTSPATLNGFDLCKIFGWAQKNENSPMNLYSTVAMLMDHKDCISLYKERINAYLPENQFCVIESRINDEGRIIVCDKKLLGVFSRKMPTLQGKETTNINVYTFALSGPPPHPFNIIFLCFLALIFFVADQIMPNITLTYFL